MPGRASIQGVSGGSGAACMPPRASRKYQVCQALHAESLACGDAYLIVVFLSPSDLESQFSN